MPVHRSMNHRASFVLMVGASVVLGCGTPAPPRLAVTLPDGRRAVLGCWRLRSVGWEELFLPGVLEVRLDTARATTYDSTLRLLHIISTDTAMQNGIYLSAWAPYQHADSIYAFISDGFSGLHFRLAVIGDSLAGRAYRFTDIPHFRSSGRVIGRRHACSVDRGK